jgi:hypothetical protein
MKDEDVPAVLLSAATPCLAAVYGIIPRPRTERIVRPNIHNSASANVSSTVSTRKAYMFLCGHGAENSAVAEQSPAQVRV